MTLSLPRAVLRAARKCHSQRAWTAFFDAFAETVATSTDPKLLDELYRLYRQDPQAARYPATFLGTLARGCLASWNLELGRRLCAEAGSQREPAFTVPAARLMLEFGHPEDARQLLERSLRLQALGASERLEILLLQANAHTEQGQTGRARRILATIDAELAAADLSAPERAGAKDQLGRASFFSGDYTRAAEHFRLAFGLHKSLGAWADAAKALFNAAVSAQNGDHREGDRSASAIAEVQALARERGLSGILSHCDAYRGLNAYQTGDYRGAAGHFREALAQLPASDQGYRRLHILSMLAYALMALGRGKDAERIGEQVRRLAGRDRSNRYRSRYSALQARLLWEKGRFAASQQLLTTTIDGFAQGQIKTLEELSAYSQYLLQAAHRGRAPEFGRLPVRASLRQQVFASLELELAQSELALGTGNHAAARAGFASVLGGAETRGFPRFRAEALGGLLKVQLASRRLGADFARQCETFLSLPAEPARKEILLAAWAYQRGELAECRRLLGRAAGRTPAGSIDAFSVTHWRAVLAGRACRLGSPWQVDILARATRCHFAPYIQRIATGEFLVSGAFPVDLRSSPALAALLDYLVANPREVIAPEEIQSQVWKQALSLQGWEQKIRNSVSRLRRLFPAAIAPITLSQGGLSFFHEAIALRAPQTPGESVDATLLRLLAEGPATSATLGHRLGVSTATTKRTLGRLLSAKAVYREREGRHIYYRLGGANRRPDAARGDEQGVRPEALRPPP